MQERIRKVQLHVFGRSYCACRDYGAGHRWGLPVPSRWVANLDARRRSSAETAWFVVKFSPRHGVGNIE